MDGIRDSHASAPTEDDPPSYLAAIQNKHPNPMGLPPHYTPSAEVLNVSEIQRTTIDCPYPIPQGVPLHPSFNGKSSEVFADPSTIVAQPRGIFSVDANTPDRSAIPQGQLEMRSISGLDAFLFRDLKICGVSGSLVLKVVYRTNICFEDVIGNEVFTMTKKGTQHVVTSGNSTLGVIQPLALINGPLLCELINSQNGEVLQMTEMSKWVFQVTSNGTIVGKAGLGAVERELATFGVKLFYPDLDLSTKALVLASSFFIFQDKYTKTTVNFTSPPKSIAPGILERHCMDALCTCLCFGVRGL